MSLIPAKCTQCGSNLNVDPSQEAAVCPVCNTPFITQNAINNYNTTNVTNIGNLHADNVNLNTADSLENKIKAAETFYTMKEYKKAYNIFNQLTAEHPYDARVWWGVLKSNTEDFTVYDFTIQALNIMKGMFEKFTLVSAGKDISQETAVFDKYYKKHLEVLSDKLKNVDAQIKAVSEQMSREQAKFQIAETTHLAAKKELTSKTDMLYKKKMAVEGKGTGGVIAICIVCAVILFIWLMFLSDVGLLLRIVGGFLIMVVAGIICALPDIIKERKAASIGSEMSSIKRQTEKLESDFLSEKAKHDEIIKGYSQKLTELNRVKSQVG